MDSILRRILQLEVILVLGCFSQIEEGVRKVFKNSGEVYSSIDEKLEPKLEKPHTAHVPILLKCGDFEKHLSFHQKEFHRSIWKNSTCV
ncbi:hypothetical protein K7X08_021599 [Anisodus acutangulus]|uniref:Uncharacterized protein n=1 Tax=Anisodus acutangulus TaxID=402998 RepID=A0A9Q1M8A2_9SOLA|nr:hypothetical protein K7X08_021599 [Anisodus acutangulus]